MFVFLRRRAHEGGMQMHTGDVRRHSQDPFFVVLVSVRFSQQGEMQHPPPSNSNTHTISLTYKPTMAFIFCLLDVVCASGQAVRELHKWISLQKYTRCVLQPIHCIS